MHKAFTNICLRALNCQLDPAFTQFLDYTEIFDTNIWDGVNLVSEMSEQFKSLDKFYDHLLHCFSSGPNQ